MLVVKLILSEPVISCIWAICGIAVSITIYSPAVKLDTSSTVIYPSWVWDRVVEVIVIGSFMYVSLPSLKAS